MTYDVTPVQKITDFLTAFSRLERDAFDGFILNVCAGGSKGQTMSYPLALEMMDYPSYELQTVDIREDSLAGIRDDYLSLILDESPRTIIAHPPLEIADRLLRKAIADVEHKGFVILLLPFDFIGGVDRYILMNEIGIPKYTYLHSEPMHFPVDGKSRPAVYAHFVWQKGLQQGFSILNPI